MIIFSSHDEPHLFFFPPTKQVSRKALLAAADRLQADDDCFRCAEGGRLIMCDVKSCSKVYHLECLDLQATPKGLSAPSFLFCSHAIDVPDPSGALAK